jgi:hypothetical protein
MGYVSHAQRKAVWASKKDGGKGNPNKKSPAKLKPTSLRKKRKTQEDIRNEAIKNRKPHRNRFEEQRGNFKTIKKNPLPDSKKKSPFKLQPKSPLMGKISASCKARAKKKFKVWPSAYASGWGVRCTQGKV